MAAGSGGSGETMRGLKIQTDWDSEASVSDDSDPFACRSCGGVALSLPRKLFDAASITCTGCGALAGTWGALKIRTRAVVLREAAERGLAPERLSTDPLEAL